MSSLVLTKLLPRLSLLIYFGDFPAACFSLYGDSFNVKHQLSRETVSQCEPPAVSRKIAHFFNMQWKKKEIHSNTFDLSTKAMRKLRCDFRWRQGTE